MQCEQCMFFDPIPGGTDGRCRFNAPQPRVEDARQLEAYWPLVDALDWCGQWKQRIEYKAGKTR